jgi:predicted SAM-dependent methyltransferase
MPRWFESVQTLPDEPPFAPELFEHLGLRGIHFGSARRLERGWLNTDRNPIREQGGRETEFGRLSLVNGELYFFRHDSTEPYPVADGSFEWAYSEHFIEHLTLEEGIDWLAEVRRLLRPGGLVRVTTPHLERYVRAYVDHDDPFYEENRKVLAGLRRFQGEEIPERRGWMVNNIFYSWRHRWIYDFGELEHALVSAGFDPDTVTQHSFAEGAVEEVAALDAAGRSFESIYVEARRPGRD